MILPYTKAESNSAFIYNFPPNSDYVIETWFNPANNILFHIYSDNSCLFG